MYDIRSIKNITTTEAAKLSGNILKVYINTNDMIDCVFDTISAKKSEIDGMKLVFVTPSNVSVWDKYKLVYKLKHNDIKNDYVFVSMSDDKHVKTTNILDVIPTISVIMPVYNTEKYLRESMDCLVRQTLCNIEIICVNDCSTDGSLDILREYADMDPRIKIINNKNNIGSAASRNVALSVARGMYIGCVDSDDLVNDEYFMNLFAASQYGKYDIGATGIVTMFSDDCDDTTRKNVGIDEKEYVVSGNAERTKIIVSTGVSCNKIYKKSFLDAKNIKYLDIKNAAEDNYFTDLTIIFADKIGVTSKSEYFYRQNPVSQTKVLKGKKDIQMFDVYSKILEFVKQNKTENRDFWIDTIYKRVKYDFWTFFDTMNYECHDEFIRTKRQFFGDKPQIVVSLTSYPARIDKVPATINSIINQTMRPDRIVLALGEDKFLNKEADLPSELLELRGRGLEILWCKDIRSYTKLLPALKKYPDDIIITVDDDCMYDTDLVRMLYENHRKYPSDILCHRAHEVILKHGYPIPYKKWGWEKYGPSASYRNFLTGVGGVLYPPHSLPDMVFDESEFMSLCPRADDIWFWAMAVLNNKKIRIIKHNKQHPTLVDGTQDTGLMHSNVGNDGNDKQLAELLKKYPELLKRIRHVPLYESCKYKHSKSRVILFGHHIAKVKIKPYILFPYYLLAMMYMRYVKLPFARIKTALHRTEMHKQQIQDIMEKLAVLQNQNEELQQQLHDMQKLNTSCDNESN